MSLCFWPGIHVYILSVACSGIHFSCSSLFPKIYHHILRIYCSLKQCFVGDSNIIFKTATTYPYQLGSICSGLHISFVSSCCVYGNIEMSKSSVPNRTTTF